MIAGTKHAFTVESCIQLYFHQ